jgi:hypothetical protein
MVAGMDSGCFVAVRGVLLHASGRVAREHPNNATAH